MKPILFVLVLFFVVALLAACAPPAAAPTPVPPTATPIPPTATPVPPTPTTVPPTVTPIPLKPTPAEPTPTLAPEAKSKLTHESFTSPSLEGNLLGTLANRSPVIYLPPSYDKSDKRYPVIYSLPFWGSGNATDFGIPDAIDRWVHAGKMQEAIIVEVDMSSRDNVGDYYQNNPVVGNWEGYIADDLVKYIDSKYRTLPDPANRAIIGLMDAGGSGALHMGLKRPDVFGVVATMAPGLGSEPFVKTCALESYKGKGGYLWAPAYACKQLAKALSLSFASDPNKKPFAPDPMIKVNDEWQANPEVWDKAVKVHPQYDIEGYKSQDAKLKAMLLVHSPTDQATSIESVRKFVKAMTDAGIPVDFREATTPEEWGHHFWDNDMLLDFLSKQLAFK